MLTSIKRLSFITILLLLIPLIGMQFPSMGFNWTLSDFVIAALLIFGIGLLYLFATRNTISIEKKILTACVLLFVFAIIWIQLAVGIADIPYIAGS